MGAHHGKFKVNSHQRQERPLFTESGTDTDTGTGTGTGTGNGNSCIYRKIETNAHNPSDNTGDQLQLPEKYDQENENHTATAVGETVEFIDRRIYPPNPTTIIVRPGPGPGPGPGTGLGKSTRMKAFIISIVCTVLCLAVVGILIGLSYTVCGSPFGLVVRNCQAPPPPSPPDNVTTTTITFTTTQLENETSTVTVTVTIAPVEAATTPIRATDGRPEYPPNFKLFPHLSECGHPATSQLLRENEIQKNRRSQGHSSIPELDIEPDMEAVSGNSRKRRVVGGQEVRDKTVFPWMVQVNTDQYQNGTWIPGFTCGGTLITKRYVLTAAHCVYKRHVVSVKLNDGTVINIEKVISHTDYEKKMNETETELFLEDSESEAEDYESSSDYETSTTDQPSWNNSSERDTNYVQRLRLRLRQKLNPQRPFDIALLRLEAEVDTLTPNYFHPVCLPLQRFYNLTHAKYFSYYENNNTLFGAGWGFTNPNNTRGSEHLKYVSLPLVTKNYCRAVYSDDTDITPTMVCAGGTKGEDVCGGDSGGPLFQEVKGRSFQVGVASFGKEPCGHTEAPSVFINLSNYIPWIVSSLES